VDQLFLEFVHALLDLLAFREIADKPTKVQPRFASPIASSKGKVEPSFSDPLLPGQYR
jgi:hypothetical protein